MVKAGLTSAVNFEEREKRVNDAIALKEPDRVPIMVLSGFFPVHYDGTITCEEAMYDYEKVMPVWTKFLQDFEPDMTDNPFTTRFLGAVLDALGSQQLKWPGKGVGVMSSYQFVEGEYM